MKKHNFKVWVEGAGVVSCIIRARSMTEAREYAASSWNERIDDVKAKKTNMQHEAEV